MSTEDDTAPGISEAFEGVEITDMAGGAESADPPTGDPGGPSVPNLGGFEAFRNTTPNPSLDDVGSLDDIRDNWQRYGMRGVLKVTSVDEAEAWMDLLKAALGAVMESMDDSEDSAEPAGAVADSEVEAVEQAMASEGNGF